MRRPLALAVLMVVLFLTFLDNTVVSVALGSVQGDLHAGVTALQWVVSAYALTFAAAMLAFGMVGDEFGRKRVMLAGAGIFCAGSVLCAMAPSVHVLIAGRAVKGIGAAASEPGTLSMLRHMYADERPRARAVGVWTAVCGLALALGPVIGGALVGLWDWRAIFWFNLLFGAAALGLGAVVLRESADPAAHRVDVAGTVLGAAALSALVFGVISAETAGFAAPGVIALLCISAAAGTVFGWHESRTAHPLLDLRYLRVPEFLTANVVAFCAYFATFAVFFFTALYLAEVAGFSGYRIALVFLPMTVLMTVTSLLAGRWTSAAGMRWSVFAGWGIFGTGLLLTAFTINARPGFLQLAAALALTGIGVGGTVVPITSTALSAVPPERSGMAASAANTSREIGAVLGALVNAQLHAHLTGRLRQLGIPANFQSIVINAIETGTVAPQRASAKRSRRRGPGPGQTRPGRHPRRLRRVLLGATCRAAHVGGTCVRRRAIHSCRCQETQPFAGNFRESGSPERYSRRRSLARRAQDGLAVLTAARVRVARSRAVTETGVQQAVLDVGKVRVAAGLVRRGKHASGLIAGAGGRERRARQLRVPRQADRIRQGAYVTHREAAFPGRLPGRQVSSAAGIARPAPRRPARSRHVRDGDAGRPAGVPQSRALSDPGHVWPRTSRPARSAGPPGRRRGS